MIEQTPIEQKPAAEFQQPAESNPVMPDGVDRPEIVLSEDNAGPSYLERRERAGRENSRAIELLRQYTTPEEFEALKPITGIFSPGEKAPIRVNLEIGGEKKPKGKPASSVPGAYSPQDSRTEAVLQALFSVESAAFEDPYNIPNQQGGKAFGKYQFLPTTFDLVTNRYISSTGNAPPDTWESIKAKGIDVSKLPQTAYPMTPANQETLAAFDVDSHLRSGATPSQVARYWYTGSISSKATKGVGSKGSGAEGIAYDVPGYVSKFDKAYAGASGAKLPGGYQMDPGIEPPAGSWRNMPVNLPQESMPIEGPESQQMALDLILKGWKPEEIEAEISGGIHEPIYSPVDLLADIATAGATSAGRAAISTAAKGGIKEGTAALGKEVVSQVATGALAGGAMTAAEATGAGPLIQTVSALLGPTATMAVLQMPRKALATYLSRLEISNSETYQKLVKAMAENPESKIAKNFQEVVGKMKELAMGYELGAVGDIKTIRAKGTTENVWTRPAKTQADLDARAADVVKRWNEANPSTLVQSISEVPREFISKVQTEQMGTAWLNPKDPASPATLKEKGAFENNPKSLFVMKEKKEALESAILQDKLSKPFEKYSININQERLQTPEDISNLIETVARKLPVQINKARRGKIDAEAMKQLAWDLGWTEETLLARRRGQAFNAEQVMAARWIMIDSAEKLMEMAKRIRAGENSDEMLGLFRERLSRHAAIQAQVSGMTAEAGRALNAFNIMAKTGDLRLQEIREHIVSSGGRGTIEDMANSLVEVANANGGKLPLASVNATVKKLQKATTADMILEAWIMGLLSGPQTHSVNMLSNALTAIWQVPERKFASWISQSPFGSGEILAGEATAQAFGMVEGFKQGLAAMGKAIKTGEGSDVLGKVDAPRRAISAQNVSQTWIGQKLPPQVLEQGGFLARGIDLLGEGIRIPGRFLTAEDELFKSMGYVMEINAQAFRQASSEGLQGDSLARRITELVQNPPDNIKASAVDAAHYVTFTRELGKTGRMIQGATNSLPALKVIMPFMRTPVNILKFTAERTPLAPVMASVRADIVAGGARRDLALARIGLGSTIMATAATMAAGGVITGGGPSDKDMREVLRREGWQPYSIHLHGTYYSINRLDFPGNLLSMAADATELIGQVGEADANRLAGAAIVSISQNVLSKTYCRGLADFFSVFTEAQKTENASRGEAYVKRLIGSVVPSLFATIARTQDPTMRDVSRYKGFDAVVASIKARTPGYSTDLPPQRNLWGEPVVYGSGLGPDIASPIYTNSEKPSAIDDEMLRLRVAVKMPSPIIDGVELSPKEYDRYVSLAGNELKYNGLGCKDKLERLVKSPEYQRQSDGNLEEGFEGGKAVMIRSIINAYREMARAKLLDANGEFPELHEIWRKTQLDKAQAQQPK